MRRLAALLIALVFVAVPAAAKDLPPPAETIDLWSGSPPPGSGKPAGPEKIGKEGAATGAYWNITQPRMEIYRPANPNGAAVLVIGGGGYFRIQIGSAAKPIAERLMRRGITAIVLYYRLPGDGWNDDAPFQDGQRAMRMLRYGATRFGIDPARLGVIGFSAGGHLAGMLATRGGHDFYPKRDAIDAQSAIPAFAGMIYPVVSLRAPIDTTRTFKELSGLPDFVNAFSVEAQVGPATPPVFLAHAADDPIADVEHSLRMFAAMRAARRPVEMHIFETGGHSFGVGKPGTLVAAWPRLFLTWLEAQGVIKREEKD
ncbi:alpha/beta hydrolase [Sphingomonas sp. AOB5]|uniref:alpha/beta hydrolase n=1 Tax=Sphingomonas sp. AOB5 TaxID=3034017 RepID=UPI0023F75BD4|nr:alpha/beta hydrolase [Sphingomonas sp. AOB5]MDF7777165.1 alpha/beta hydrolase [Sphingomonas sp. AOB5]